MTTAVPPAGRPRKAGKASKATRNTREPAPASAKAPVSAARPRAARMTPEARKANLLQGLLHVCAAKGLGEAYHSDVAEWAGVSVPTMFHYFPSKDLMVEAATREVYRFLIEEVVEPHFEEPENAANSIINILMAFCDAIDTHPDYIRVWLEWSVAIRGELWNNYLEFYNAALRGVRVVLLRGLRDGSIAKGVNLDVASRVIVGGAHMITQMRFAGSDRDQVYDTVTSLVQSYLRRE